MARATRTYHQLTEEQTVCLAFARLYFTEFPDDCLLHHNVKISDDSKFKTMDVSGKYERALRWYSLHKTVETKATLVQKWLYSKESRTAKAERKLRWFKKHQATALAYTVIHGPSGELYIKGKEIGRGNYGKVYLGIKETGEYFSIKEEPENSPDHGQPNEEKILADIDRLIEPKLCHTITTTPRLEHTIPHAEELFITITPYLGKTLTEHARTISQLSTKDRIRQLFAPLCQVYHNIHTGKAFVSKTSRANCDVNPNNILVLRDEIYAIDLATAKEKINDTSYLNSDGTRGEATGNPAFLPPRKILEKISFKQRDIIGIMRSGFIDEEFNGFNGKQKREKLKSVIEHKVTSGYNFIFNKNIVGFAGETTPEEATDPDDFPTDWHIIRLLSVVDIVEINGEIFLERHDSTNRPPPKSLIELKTKCMLIYLEIDPDILDQIDEDSTTKKALYALAQADIYHKPLWRNLFSLASQPQNALVLLILAIANIDIKLLQEKPLIQLTEMVKTPKLIVSLWHNKAKFLAAFVKKIISNNHFLTMLIRLEKLNPKFISEKLGQNKELQKALTVLMKFDSSLFTARNVQAIENYTGHLFPSPLKKTHEFIAEILDGYNNISLDFDGNLFKATLKALRIANLYKGGEKDKWYSLIEDNGELQLSIFILVSFNYSLVTEATALELMADSKPTTLAFKKIKIEARRSHQFYNNEYCKPQAQNALKALIYFALGNTGENQPAITAMWQTLIENCQQGTPTLRPLIALHTELLAKKASQASECSGSEASHQHYQLKNGSLLPLTNGRQAPPNIAAAPPPSLNG
jgi:serine/threonine protein kinase